MTKITRTKYSNGAHFIFLTQERELNSAEVQELTEKYLDVSLDRTQAHDALLVDLRPRVLCFVIGRDT